MLQDKARASAVYKFLIAQFRSSTFFFSQKIGNHDQVMFLILSFECPPGFEMPAPWDYSSLPKPSPTPSTCNAFSSLSTHILILQGATQTPSSLNDFLFAPGWTRPRLPSITAASHHLPCIILQCTLPGFSNGLGPPRGQESGLNCFYVPYWLQHILDCQRMFVKLIQKCGCMVQISK